MKKQGFTLIELLAVIVILSILSLIAIPTIRGVVEKVRFEAVRDSAYGLIETADLYYSMNGESTFTCNSVSCENAEEKTLKFKGQVPSSGTIVATKGSTLENIVIGNYCVKGDRNNLDVGKDCNGLDLTAPEFQISNITSTSKSISFEINAEDPETGIKSIKYEVNGVKSEDTFDTTSVDFTKRFDNLIAGTNYTIKVTVTNGKGTSVVKTITKSTISLGVLTIRYDNTPEEPRNGYLKKQVAYLDYEANDAEGYYIYSDRASISSTNSIKECGTDDTEPGNCTDLRTANLQAGKWYYFNTAPRITFDTSSDTESIIIARVTNGVTISANAAGVISKIKATLDASEVEYTNNGWDNVENVKQALDDLRSQLK